MKKSIYILILFCFPFLALGQTGDEIISFSVEEIYEQLASEVDEDVDLTVLLEDLYYFSENPIQLNKATRSQLDKLPFLSDAQVQELLDYPGLHGKFVSIYELGLLSSFDPMTIQRLIPFITLVEKDEPRKLNIPTVAHYGRHQLLLRYTQLLEEQQGFLPASDSLLEKSPNSRYLGSPPKLYARYQFKYHDNISIGFTGEKDAGEEFFRGSQKQGFDFNSAHLFYQNTGIVRQVAVGDYHARFGQGLILWSGYSFGKSLDNIQSVERMGQGIRPYTSTDENNFLRGAAATFGWKKLRLTTFYSNKKIDGNKVVSDTLDSEEFYVTSFQETGLHSTPGEIEDRKTVREEIVGASLEYSANKAKLAFNYAHAKYGAALQRNTQPYSQFYFQGDEVSNLSLAYRFKLWRINLFGETAMNDNSTFASINGLSVSLTSSASFVLVNRYYPADYTAVKANSFGEKQGSQNENGTYLAFEFVPYQKLKLTAWYDTYRFPWLRYGVDAPSEGHEYALQLNWFQSSDFQAYARFRFEQSESNLTKDEVAVTKLQQVNKQSIRLQLQYKVAEGLILKNRIEYSQISDEETSEEGWLMYQDIQYAFQNIPLKLYARYALFDTDGWDSRVYAWENDVLYAFSVPAMYDKGTRSYLMAKYSISKNMDAWARISRTVYTNKDVIGSGLTTIDGDTKTEVKLMLRVKF
ncbi:MAG: helix-hairpin-helix domain-containing protein [Bacteroidales bacterium]|nr:helix-hairpin-helix domain-containing protein [Bacteroidales bacterium]MCF8458584.1 helix-hairpin-helix domain-containing protein [Bacteroidales bacterium]